MTWTLAGDEGALRVMLPEASVQPARRDSDLAHLCARRKVTDWRLIFGANEVVWGSNKPVKPPLQERFVEEIIIHEKYVSGLEINDIALIKITPPVPCGPFIGPGCLPQFKAGPPRAPQTCWVTGWGYLKEKGEYCRGSGVDLLVPPWRSLMGRGTCADARLSPPSPQHGAVSGSCHCPCSQNNWVEFLVHGLTLTCVRAERQARGEPGPL